MVHPEVLKEVQTKFKELHAKNPLIDGVILWEMARDYVWTLCLAETGKLKGEILQ